MIATGRFVPRLPAIAVDLLVVITNDLAHLISTRHSLTRRRNRPSVASTTSSGKRANYCNGNTPGPELSPLSRAENPAAHGEPPTSNVAPAVYN